MAEMASAAEQAKFQRLLLEQNIQTAMVLGTAIAMRDHGTGAHNHRVALYTCALGEALGFELETQRNLVAGAFLHDIGKIAIPDRILLKEGKLTVEEMREMRRHSEFGAQLLGELPAFHGAIPVVRHHHERYDGSGYPDGLAAEQIPMIARVFSIVDVFDALVSERPYKHGYSMQQAIKYLEEATGSHFDPRFAPLSFRLLPNVFQRFGALSEEELKPHIVAIISRHFGG